PVRKDHGGQRSLLVQLLKRDGFRIAVVPILGENDAAGVAVETIFLDMPQPASPNPFALVVRKENVAVRARGQSIRRAGAVGIRRELAAFCIRLTASKHTSAIRTLLVRSSHSTADAV